MPVAILYSYYYVSLSTNQYICGKDSVTRESFGDSADPKERDLLPHFDRRYRNHEWTLP